MGAQKGSILQLVMRHVVLLMAVGIGVRVGISLWATRLTQKMLFGLDPNDAKTVIVSVIVLIGCALIAGYLPARRATRTDPMLTLREE